LKKLPGRIQIGFLIWDCKLNSIIHSDRGQFLRKLNFNIYSFYGFCAILLWSSTVALTRSITEKAGPFTAAGCVCLLSGIMGIIFFGIKGGFVSQLKTLPSRYIFSGGVFFVLHLTVFYLAMSLAKNRHEVLQLGLINYLWCFFTILFSLHFLNKKAHLLLVPATLLAMFGVFLVVAQGSSLTIGGFVENLAKNPVAYGLILAGAICWALYSNLSSLFAVHGCNSAVSIFLSAAGLMLLCVKFIHGEQSQWNVHTMTEILAMSFISILAYNCWDIGMRKGNMVLIAAGSYLIPFFSVLFSCIYLNVMAGLSLWLGCIFIIAGAFMSWLSVTEKNSN